MSAIVTVAVAALMLSACAGEQIGDAAGAADDSDAAGTTDDSDAVGGSELGTIRLLQAAPSSVVFNTLFVGEALGYFEDEGIEVVELDAGELTEVAFLDNGQADIAFTGTAEILQGVEAGVDMHIIYEYFQTAIEGIVVSESSEIADAADLEGRRVGLAGDADEPLLDVALDIVGVERDAVDRVVVGDNGGVVANALASGDVDAYVGSTRDFRNLVAAGEPIRPITPDDLLENPGESFIVTADVFEQRRDDLEGFLRAWAKATHASLQSDEILTAMATEAVPEAVQDPDLLAVGLEQARDGSAPLTEGYGEVRPEVWERVADQLVSIGAVSEGIELDPVLVTDLAESANDFDRSEVEADIAAWGEDNS